MLESRCCLALSGIQPYSRKQSTAAGGNRTKALSLGKSLTLGSLLIITLYLPVYKIKFMTTLK